MHWLASETLSLWVEIHVVEIARYGGYFSDGNLEYHEPDFDRKVLKPMEGSWRNQLCILIMPALLVLLDMSSW